MSKIQLGKSAGWLGIAGGAIPLIVQVADAIWSERRKKKQRADRAISEEVLKALRMMREKDGELAQLRGQLVAREEEVLRVRKELAEVYRQLEEERRKTWWRKMVGK